MTYVSISAISLSLSTLSDIMFYEFFGQKLYIDVTKSYGGNFEGNPISKKNKHVQLT